MEIFLNIQFVLGPRITNDETRTLTDCSDTFRLFIRGVSGPAGRS
jgi:hypothetical protein